MQVSFRIDQREVLRGLNGMQSQVAFATQQAINNAAFGLRDRWPEIISPQVQGGPVAFTANKRAIFVQKASKRDLTAYVELRYLQADYLEAAIEGERRDLKRSEIRANLPRAVPARGVSLDKRGNVRLPGAGQRGIKYGRILQDAVSPGGDFFIVPFSEATEKRPAGIWQKLKGKRRTKPEGVYQRGRDGDRSRVGKRKKAREDGRARPLFVFVQGDEYKQSIKFHEPMIRQLNRLAPAALNRAVNRALATAR